MDTVLHLLEAVTIWHWLGLGIILLTLEVAVGTFDLLWVAIAAFTTALVSLIAPAWIGGWQGQLVIFGVIAVVFVVMGRTLFKGLRRAPSSHPNINDRTSAMIGQHGRAAGEFQSGAGRVKIGDTMWAAQATDGSAIVEGDDVIVAGAEGTTLKVKLA
jgi:membrane protein implicated in regulation of membrane protease activity